MKQMSASAFLLGLAAAAPAGAATIDVACSTPALIAAIDTSNGNTESNTLRLAPACTYELTAPVTGVDTLPSGLPDVRVHHDLVIDGRGATIQRSAAAGTSEFRIMSVVAHPAGSADLERSFELRDVTLRNGVASGAIAAAAYGGGLLLLDEDEEQSAPLHAVLRRVTVADSRAGFGGGIAAIFKPGDVLIDHATLRGNHAVFQGGGACVSGTVTVESSLVTDNTQGMASLLVDEPVGGLISGGAGLGLLGDAATIIDSEISYNEGWGIGGGGIGVLLVPTVTVLDSRIHDNVIHEPDPPPGNAPVLELGSGGGIAMAQMGFATPSVLRIERSAIYGNAADVSGGGVGLAGAVAATIQNSTVSGNTAGARSGGIGIAATRVDLVNVTLVDNAAPVGAGVDVGRWTDLILSQGGTPFYVYGHAGFYNTVLANNTGGADCAVHDGAGIVGNVASLLRTDAAGTSACDGFDGLDFALRGDPMLSAFANHGGPDPSYLPLPGSPLLDAGSAGLNDSATDQRGAGFARIVGAAIDIGAIEAGNADDDDTIFRNGFEVAP